MGRKANRKLPTEEESGSGKEDFPKKGNGEYVSEP